MIPDFLKQKEVRQDLSNLSEIDMMGAALRKQDDQNKDAPSMAEVLAKKRAEQDARLEEAKTSGKPSKTDVEDRKTRLLAQRDALRKAKEEKRQEELQTFNAKTETKQDLFNELKKMDQNLEAKKKAKEGDVEAQRRLEMFKKVRKDMNEEKKEENEANYNKRVTQIEQKDAGAAKKKDDDGEDDWFGNMKTFGTDA